MFVAFEVGGGVQVMQGAVRVEDARLHGARWSIAQGRLTVRYLSRDGREWESSTGEGAGSGKMRMRDPDGQIVVLRKRSKD